MKKESIKLNKSQLAYCLRFERAIDRFLKMVNNFKVEKIERDCILGEIIKLRNEVLQIRYESIIFYDFSKKWTKKLEDIEFDEVANIDKIKITIEKNAIENAKREELIENSLKKLLDDKNYKYIIFHLTEIYSDYLELKKILEHIISNESNIHPDLLHTYLAGDFYMMNWHTFDHIDDLVSFENNEFIYTKGLMTNISEFLEDGNRKIRFNKDIAAKRNF